MISLCTVVVSRMNKYMSVFYDMLRRHSKLINEVIIAKTDDHRGSSLDKVWMDGGIKYNMFASRIPSKTIPKFKPSELAQVWCGHAYGLHDCLKRVSNEYIMFCDPDIFFCMNVAETYLELMDKYSLNIVGIGHFNPRQQCYLDFPCITCCLVKRSTLPDDKFMGGAFWVMNGLQRTYPPVRHYFCYGKWLMPGIASVPTDFPNPDGSFDAGCNLYLWNKAVDGKWISFAKHDEGLYRTGQYASNFSTKIDLPDQNMLIHRIEGARGADPTKYIEMYEEINGPVAPVDERNEIPGGVKKYSQILLL